jgi:hypothetical protein
VALDGDRAYSVLPGFRDHRGLPDAWFELTEPPGRGQVAGNLTLGRVRVDGDRLLLDGTVGFTADSAPRLRVSLQQVPDGERVPGHRTLERYDGPPAVDTPVTLTDAGPGEPTRFHAEVDLRPLAASPAPRRRSVRLRADIGGSTYDLALPFTGKPRTTEVRSGLRAARVTARRSRRDSLVLGVEPLPPTHVARRALRRVTRK